MGDPGEPNPAAELERFYARNRQALIKVARGILGDEHEAEDIVQESLAAVLRRIQAGPPRRIGAYLFKAVEYNALKALARRRMHDSFESAGPLAEDDREEQDELEIDPLLLEWAILQLPPSQQAVIRMKYYTGYTFRQIGEVLSISINTAASRCRYALAAMRKGILSRR